VSFAPVEGLVCDGAVMGVPVCAAALVLYPSFLFKVFSFAILKYLVLLF
jgi:hypothetical protein